MSTLFPVSFQLGDSTRIYSPDEQSQPANTVTWKRVLLNGHGKAIVRCCCKRDDTPRRLSIRYRADNDSFFLARFPETGHQHDPDCGYYSPDPSASGLGSYRRGVVEELADGKFKIKLKVGLQRRPVTDTTSEPSTTESNTKAPGKAAMTLLGLLHFLWTVAGLERWSPAMVGKRNLGRVSYFLLQAAGEVKAGRLRLADSLLVATASANDKLVDWNAKCTRAAAQKDRRLIVIAPLARYREDYETAPDRPPIMGFNGFPYLFLDSDLWLKTKARFDYAFTAWRSGQRVIAILQCDVPAEQQGDRYASEVHDIALMVVTQEWIPVDSSYEQQVCAALVEQGRRFSKPLIFDSEEATFPDFWLQDVGADFPMEVWGLNTPEYLARKHEKSEFYTETYGPEGWWSWDAAASEPMPTLPASRQLPFNHSRMRE